MGRIEEIILRGDLHRLGVGALFINTMLNHKSSPWDQITNGIVQGLDDVSTLTSTLAGTTKAIDVFYGVSVSP